MVETAGNPQVEVESDRPGLFEGAVQFLNQLVCRFITTRGTSVPVEARDWIGGDRGSDVGVDCVVAGIATAEPAIGIQKSQAMDGSTFTVEGDAFDLSAFDRTLVLGGGNAVEYAAEAIETLLDKFLDGGAVVTDNPVDILQVQILPGNTLFQVRLASVALENSSPWPRGCRSKTSPSRLSPVKGVHCSRHPMLSPSKTSSRPRMRFLIPVRYSTKSTQSANTFQPLREAGWRGDSHPQQPLASSVATWLTTISQ